MFRFILILLAACIPGFAKDDWLITPPKTHSSVEVKGSEVALSNGLIRRTWRVRPQCATVALDNLMTGASVIRGVKPEALLTVDGAEIAVGGLKGQPDYAYLLPRWLDSMTADPKALPCKGYEQAPVQARLGWKKVRYASSTEWPPRGAGMVFHYEGSGLSVDVHYEMYDGLPAMAKWVVIRNNSPRTVRLNKFVSEILAVVEQDSAVDAASAPPATLHVESDYSFAGMDPKTANRTTYWGPDPDYATQVNYQLIAPVLLESRPPLGPNVKLEPGGTLETFHNFELVYDSTDRERNGMARRRMYRTVAPWATENPILMHIWQSDPESVKRAIDQCAEVGFEMAILSFGSGFNAEKEDPKYREQLRGLVEYGKSKGVELGGYSLLASRKVSDADDAINPKTGKPGGAIFGDSPCLRSRWGEDYFRKLRTLYETTGLAVLEHDGSYPGDVCASETHPGHEGSTTRSGGSGRRSAISIAGAASAACT